MTINLLLNRITFGRVQFSWSPRHHVSKLLNRFGYDHWIRIGPCNALIGSLNRYHCLRSWTTFDNVSLSQMMEKNHGFWDKVDQDMKVKYELAAQEMGIFPGINFRSVIPSETYVAGIYFPGYISEVQFPVKHMLQDILQDIFQKCNSQ